MAGRNAEHIGQRAKGFLYNGTCCAGVENDYENTAVTTPSPYLGKEA